MEIEQSGDLQMISLPMEMKKKPSWEREKIAGTLEDA
jgi:hypothetical protein